MKLYKVLDEHNRSMHGGRGQWTPGKWRSVRGPLVPCSNGLHLASADELFEWLGPRIWEVDTAGEVIEADGRYVARKARIVREVETWTEQSARHFAADCAEDVLQYADPEWRETLEVVIHTVRAYADGAASEDDLDAARDAARAAARAAAWAAAWAAARDAARDAAWAAARDAAWARYSGWLVERLGIVA